MKYTITCPNCHIAMETDKKPNAKWVKQVALIGFGDAFEWKCPICGIMSYLTTKDGGDQSDGR